MHAIVTPLDRKNPFLLTGVQRLTWSDFGGPLLADINHSLAPAHHHRLRLARVQVYGEWGLCWEGYVDGVTSSALTASGPNSGLTGFRRPWLFCETSTSRWQARTRINAAPGI